MGACARIDGHTEYPELLSDQHDSQAGCLQVKTLCGEQAGNNDKSLGQVGQT